MRLATQREYRGYTLLLFEERVHDQPGRHWLVIAPDGIHIVGPPKATEAEARAVVDSRLGTLPAEDNPN